MKDKKNVVDDEELEKVSGGFGFKPAKFKPGDIVLDRSHGKDRTGIVLMTRLGFPDNYCKVQYSDNGGIEYINEGYLYLV
ncbi:MAG: hypothetical protein K6F87_02160 [Lachnospiraceae bacterium]|nr:hypothetical protein [Lachnospiraceae bacterium]